MIRYVTAEKLIAELQKHDPKLPIVLLSPVDDTGLIEARQLRYLDGEPPFGPNCEVYIYEQEFANNMGQQGLVLVMQVIP